MHDKLITETSDMSAEKDVEIVEMYYVYAEHYVWYKGFSTKKTYHNQSRGHRTRRWAIGMTKSFENGHKFMIILARFKINGSIDDLLASAKFQFKNIRWRIKSSLFYLKPAS